VVYSSLHLSTNLNFRCYGAVTKRPGAFWSCKRRAHGSLASAE
jgi:hypothetical protein